MNDLEWTLIDTETSGLADPIYILEVYAQRMYGYTSVGDPFHSYLNHGIIVPPEATAVNGITTKFLKKNGKNPLQVHKQLFEYLGDRPVCAHNLSYDWGRALVPEWERLGFNQYPPKGFCTMLLCRRAFHEFKSVSLDNLRLQLGMTTDGRHTAGGDVYAIRSILDEYVRPRLEKVGISDFEAVQKFSRTTPIKKCHALLNPRATPPPLPKEWANEFYFVDSEESVHGPYAAAYINELSGGASCYVWHLLMPDWKVTDEVPAFQHHLTTSPASTPPPLIYDSPKTMGEFIGLCKGVVADDKVTNKEVYLLADWLADFEEVDNWPANEVSQMLERILEDGKISAEEKVDLLRSIRGFVGM